MHIFLHCIVQLKILTFDDVISQLGFSILHSSSPSCSCLLVPRHFWNFHITLVTVSLAWCCSSLDLLPGRSRHLCSPWCQMVIVSVFLLYSTAFWVPHQLHFVNWSQCLHWYSSTIASKLRVFDILWARYIMHFLFLQTRSPLQCKTFQTPMPINFLFLPVVVAQ